MRAAGVPQRTPPTVPAAGVAFIVLPYTVGVLGISGPEFLVIVLVAVIVVGPQRLPEYARKLTQAVRRLRVFLDDAKEQIAEEVGPELTDLNLSDLDPRNYDPRKIVRDALGEDLDAIRKDLANPIQSVAKDARDAASDAVKTEAASRSKKSLSRMIDDRAEQAREERRAQPEAVEADVEPVETAGEAQAVEADAEPVESDEAADEAVETAGEAQAVEAGAEPVESDEAAGEAQAVEAGVEPVEPDEPDETAGEAQPAEAPTPIPSSLVDEINEIEEAGEAIRPIRRVRPVSPREIVRAANAAARTRAEAAEAPEVVMAADPSDS